MKSIIKYILLNSLRDKVYLSVFLALSAIFGVAIFLGSTTLVEQAQTSLTYIAGASRTVIILGMVLFVCLMVAKSFENKEVEFILSKPVSREIFILSYLIGFFITSILIVFTLLVAIFLIAKVDILGFSIWSASLLCELFIMISFALLSSLILKNSLLAILSSFGFYLISRMMGFLLLAINLPEDFSQIKNGFFEYSLKFLSVAFPRLDLFTQSSWLVYGIEDFYRVKVVFVQSFIYIALMVFMAFHDFRKKEF